MTLVRRVLALPRAAALLALLPVLAGHPAVAAPPPVTPGPAVAVEDTMHTEVPPVLVTAPRVTLDEILDRVARGEARRDSMLRDESYLFDVRIVSHTGEQRPAELQEESVTQVWKRRPHQSREIELRHWYRTPPKKNGVQVGVSVSASDDMSEEIVNFAFRPSARREYRYHIVGRDLLGDHLIYRLAFEPVSPLALAKPSGTVWVDTRDYVIVRQEIAFRESPLPLFVRGVRRMVVERQKVGELWMLSRILLRVETTIPIPHYGASFDLGIQFTQYAVNTGLPDSLFAAPAAAGGSPRGKDAAR